MSRHETFDVVLRRPRNSDAGAIQRLLVETWIATYSTILGPEKTVALANKFFTRWSIDLAARLSSDNILVADHSGEIAGVVFTRQGGFGRLFVSMLYVHPNWQRMGIGSVLMERLRELSPPSRSIRLEVLTQNTGAISFYRSLGFQVISQVQNAQGTGATAVLMENTIQSIVPKVASQHKSWTRWLGRRSS